MTDTCLHVDIIFLFNKNLAKAGRFLILLIALTL